MLSGEFQKGMNKMPYDDKLPHPQQQKRRQARKKDRTSHMLHRASSLLPKNEICSLHE